MKSGYRSSFLLMSLIFLGIIWIKQWFKQSDSLVNVDTFTEQDVQSKYFSNHFVRNLTAKPKSNISAGSKSYKL